MAVINSSKIKDKASELGIEVRITDIQPFLLEAERIRIQHDRKLFRKSKFWSGRKIDEFCMPHLLLPNAKSIIGSYLCYLTPDEPDPSQPGHPFGLVARYTQRNYYKELKRRLRKLAEYLRKEYKAKCIAHSCGPIAEKPIAQRSGIGYYGKHSIIINPVWGSWIVLGEIITDLKIEPDEPLKMSCGECRICMKACPTGAIIEPYIIDRKKCVQDLTNYPGYLPHNIAQKWANRIYGCSLCQEVCPVNKKVKPGQPKTEIGVVGAYLPLVEILNMNEQTYRKKYANNQISAQWIHFNAIKRNALVALGNIRDRKTLPLVERFTKSSNQLLKKTARWALNQF